MKKLGNTGLVPVGKDQRLAILPWSPLAGGFLSGKFSRDTKGPEGSRRTTFDFPPIDRERVFNIIDAMRPIAAEYGVSVARVALAWLVQQPHVTSVIIGARTREQLVDNVASTELKLSDSQLDTLAEVSALPPEYPGWMLGFQGRDRGGALK